LIQAEAMFGGGFMHKMTIALLAAAMPLAALKAMPVAEFLTRAEALKAKGAMAMFSKDLGVLRNEVAGAAGQLRAERLAAQKAGRRPAYCPKTKGTSLDSDQVLAIMRAVPAQERGRTQVKDALRAHFVRTQPCS
jgi:hypothetical protein